LEILSATSGTTERVLDSGSSNRIIDLLISTGTGQKTLTINANIVLDSGTYVPTLTGVVNVDSATASTFTWSRVGQLVTVQGYVAIDPVASATLTRLGVALPVASAFTGNADCCGSIVSADGTGVTTSGLVYANATNDRAEFYYQPPSASLEIWYSHFSYRVI
jgi:hypothetical protein